MLDLLAQFGIGVPGLAAIYLTQQPRADLRRYACILGMLSQPFWFLTTIPNGQWGVVALNVVYTFLWGRSIYRLWLLKERTI